MKITPPAETEFEIEVDGKTYAARFGTATGIGYYQTINPAFYVRVPGSGDPRYGNSDRMSAQDIDYIRRQIVTLDAKKAETARKAKARKAAQQNPIPVTLDTGEHILLRGLDQRDGKALITRNGEKTKTSTDYVLNRLNDAELAELSALRADVAVAMSELADVKLPQWHDAEADLTRELVVTAEFDDEHRFVVKHNGREYVEFSMTDIESRIKFDVVRDAYHWCITEAAAGKREITSMSDVTWDERGRRREVFDDIDEYSKLRAAEQRYARATTARDEWLRLHRFDFTVFTDTE